MTTRSMLFRQIVRCSEMVGCLEGTSKSSPCATVVATQWVGRTVDERRRRWRDLHQLPEPWVGHIDAAQILFVSSNPSIGGILSEPTSNDRNRWRADDSVMRDAFESAFDTYIKDGKRIDGVGVVRYWACIKKRAEELIRHRPVRPGIDYALTEVVRCKSLHERGVGQAASHCVDQYLDRTLALTGAAVIVGIGVHARRALDAHFALGGAGLSPVSSVKVAKRERLVVGLPHPNSRGGKKTFAANVSSDDLARIGDALPGST